MENEKEENVKILATKVSIPAWRRFRRVLDKVGMTPYAAIQNFIDVIIRNGDDRHNLSPDMEELMTTFEHCEDWDKNFNLADPTSRPEISEATYYLRDKNKRGARVVHVELPFFGHWTQTYNVQQILEKFLCLTFPQLYRRLRLVAMMQECNSILELLQKVVTEWESDAQKEELRQPFEDAERTEWGRKLNSPRYKIHRRQTVDGEAARQTRLFKDEDDEQK